MTWLLALCLVKAAPEQQALDDLDRWEMSAESMLDGPAGCWEMVGVASWNWDLGRFGSNRGDAVFTGRMRDGVWSDVDLHPLGELSREGRQSEQRVYSREVRFVPLFGRVLDGSLRVAGAKERAPEERGGKGSKRHDEEEADGGPVNTLREAVDQLAGDATTSWTKWDTDRAAVHLQRQVPIGDGARAPLAKVDVFFPQSGPPTEMTVHFPQSFLGGGFPRWRVRDAVVALKATAYKGQSMPAAESFSFRFGMFGLDFHGAQTIQYQSASRCDVVTVEPG